MNDREIVNLYWQRSERAITETEQKYGRYCHIIAYNILENSEDSTTSRFFLGLEAFFPACGMRF